VETCAERFLRIAKSDLDRLPTGRTMPTALQKSSLGDLDRVYDDEARERIVAAATTDFTTARYIATVFNEHYHCTPQQFREQAG
jgi:hypothetical protein